MFDVIKAVLFSNPYVAIGAAFIFYVLFAGISSKLGIWTAKRKADKQLDAVADMHEESAKDLNKIQKEVGDANSKKGDVTYANKPID